MPVAKPLELSMNLCSLNEELSDIEEKMQWMHSG
jgi:hypothetical protein